MTSHHPHHPQPLPPPRLLSDLRLALACLYNLPHPQQQQQQQQVHLTLAQAQEFLIYFQARNVRRRMESLIQRQRDRPQATAVATATLFLMPPPQKHSETGKEVIHPGSSWLASLALLCQPSQQQQRAPNNNNNTSNSAFAASHPERLFAAQTLVHRMLRMKLRDAMDLEMEFILPQQQQQGSSSGSNGDDRDSFFTHMFAQLQQQPEPIPIQPLMEQYYQYHHQCFHPFVTSVLQEHLPVIQSHAANATATVPARASSEKQHDDATHEERIKGQMTLLTLTAVLYATAMDSYNHHPQQQQQQQVGPLLNTLGSAIVAIALRLRFPSALPRDASPSQPTTLTTTTLSPESPSVVTMVTQALGMVFQTASSSSQSQPATTLHMKACGDCYRSCLAAIPDICIGTGGGAQGRVSIDPMCLRQVAVELRTVGLQQLWEVLQQHFQMATAQQQQQDLDRVHETILNICERWARYLPLPLEFLQHTVPLASQHITNTSSQQQQQQQPLSGLRKAAFAYLVAILEGGTWTAKIILAKRVGVSSDQQTNHQQGKKRQSAKSKKRQQELLRERSDNTMEEEARAESHHRGAMACHMTVMAWEPLQAAFRAALAEADHQRQQDPHADVEIEGEGPIGCLAACADACLPHLLRNSASPATAFPQSKELFVAISETFQEMCQSQHRVIRAFSMEPIFSLHTALLEHLSAQEQVAAGQRLIEEGLQQVLVDHFFKCSMSLATACRYPENYFQNMGAESDEDLEVERNDVREVLRAVAVSERGGSTAFADVSRVPFDVTVQILRRILNACLEAVQSARDSNQLFPETAIHCFSALAKPLNQISKCYAKSGQPNDAVDILKAALQIFTTSLQSVIDAFPSASPQEIFPLSRVVNLAIASIAPMLSTLCALSGFNEEVDNVLRLCLNTAATSIARIPELACASSLGDSLYDIRGAMRSPGGEDHVGCLAIMRLSIESDVLAFRVVAAAGPDIQQLCQLHDQLKSIEVAREKGAVHGTGVVPKSRRILLNVICHLEILTKGGAGCAVMLTELFGSAVASIAGYISADPLALDDENVLFQICESTWDLAAFSPSIVESLFNYEDDQASSKMACLQVLTRAICRGYQRLTTSDDVASVDLQWNRLRGALFVLLKTGGSRTIPAALIDALETINRAECEAIRVQCQAGPMAHSSIFNDELVSVDKVPAGLFVRIVEEFLIQRDAQNVDTVYKCTAILHKSKAVVLPALFLPCPDPDNFSDPRPTLCEAWLLAMGSLAKALHDTQINDEHGLQALLIDSCAAVVTMLFQPVLSKSRKIRGQSPFMCMEGAQTLAANDFLASFFSLGPALLHGVGQQLLRQIPVDVERASAYSTDSSLHGVAIIGAALFRAAAGGLPPWFVESVPEVYAAFFAALNKDAVVFGNMLQLSMEIHSSTSFGSVTAGSRLAGPVFDGTTASAKQLFLQECVELGKQDSNGGWKRMKVILKKISGGKKIGTDFAQKASPTKWDEFDRL